MFSHLTLKSIDSDGHFVPFIGFNHVSKNICLFLLLHNKVDQSEHEEYPLIHIFITNQYTFSKINCFLLFLELPNFLKPPPFKLKSSSAREENMSKVSLFWFFFFCKNESTKKNSIVLFEKKPGPFVSHTITK